MAPIYRRIATTLISGRKSGMQALEPPALPLPDAAELVRTGLTELDEIAVNSETYVRRFRLCLGGICLLNGLLPTALGSISAGRRRPLPRRPESRRWHASGSRIFAPKVEQSASSGGVPRSTAQWPRIKMQSVCLAAIRPVLGSVSTASKTTFNGLGITCFQRRGTQTAHLRTS